MVKLGKKALVKKKRAMATSVTEKKALKLLSLSNLETRMSDVGSWISDLPCRRRMKGGTFKFPHFRMF